ncbi:MAG: sugar transferase [Flavobacteriaceae bacterium]
MSITQKIIKRLFDFSLALLGIVSLWWILCGLVLIATIDTRKFGLFSQSRIGYLGNEFLIFKIRTMQENSTITTHVTTSEDPRITNFGRFLRKYKLDELPQLINVLMGNMSLVGPRPDVAGFADKLTGDDRIILSVKPGITGLASLYFRNEEDILAQQTNPLEYNKRIIWPKKVDINKDYIINYSFKTDLNILFKTLFNVKK